MTPEENELYAQAIADIANKKEIADRCEPHVMNHHKLTSNDVLRVVYSRQLFLEGLKKKK